MEIQVQQNVLLSQYTTYRVGGPALYFAEAKNWEAFYGLREFSKKEGIPFIVLGGGSNTLFADDGCSGLVILNRMDKIIFQENTVMVEGGVSTIKLAMLAAEYNLGGISGLAYVPGTIGGAVCGNAGVPDITMADVFLNATILPSPGDRPMIVGQDYARFSYRDSHFITTGDIILSATLQLRPVPREVTKSEINKYIRERTIKQPVGLTCGSFFKNPGQFPSAGWLIEQSGCKGMKLGGAMVSEKHANWIMNTGKATASDIINLALKVQRKVKEKCHVELEPEVRILPENPFRKNRGEK